MSKRLCEICRTIPFEELLTFDIQEYRGPERWSLGKFGDVRARKCRFCELIVPICFDGTSSYARDPPKDSREIGVRLVSSGFTTDCSPYGTFIGLADHYERTSVLCVKTSFPEWIDVQAIKKWIAICQTQHHDFCDRSPVFNPGTFPRNNTQQLDLRLIDTHTMCIVYAQRGCEYVALSYVWGSRIRSRLVLTSDNEEAMMQHGSLSEATAQTRIPQTIKDAMSFVQLLGQRYLWVDSLCLLQDDEEDLAASIAVMDLFYEMAALTIIAATGDAWHGLPGINPTPRRVTTMNRSVRDDIKLSIIPDLQMALRGSLYSSRAWTMQEEVLSNRLVVFVGDQVFFQCNEGTCSEAIIQKREDRPHFPTGAGSSMYDTLFIHDDIDFRSFPYVVMYYMSRNLSFSNDVLRGAQGMLRRYAIMSGVQCFEGLPGPIDRSILFKTASEPPSSKFGRRAGFPSYSWIGWYSCPYYDSDVECEASHWLDATNPNNAEPNDQVVKAWILWFCKREDGKVSRIDSTGRLRKSSPPTIQIGQSRASGAMRQIRESISDFDTFAIKATNYRLLLFWTICINLNLTYRSRWEAPASRIPLTGREGEPCGTLAIDEGIPGGGQVKLALIALTRGTYWALALRWKDGLAERYGMAELRYTVLDDCLEPGPRWRQIALG